MEQTNQQSNSFNVYYIEPDTEDIQIKTIEARKPNDDILYIYSNELQNIRNLNIKDFSYVVFEEDINRLNDSEFEYFWSKFFLPWLNYIDENYLDISIEQFKFQLTSTLEKRYLIKKIIHFIMFLLPYMILKKILQKKNLTDYNETIEYFKDIYKYNPKEIKQLFIKEIDEIIQYSTNFLNTITQVIKSSKKDTLENLIGLLDNQISKQNDYYLILKDIIYNTPTDKLMSLIGQYLDNDFENIAF